MINAIQQGVLTKSTKESLEELEAAKEELETRLANEQLSKPPKISAEFMTFWLHRFRKLDVTKQSHRKMLIDTFINAIYLYDDKMLITFNYKDGTKKITFSDIQEASKRDASGSDLECSPAPQKKPSQDAMLAMAQAVKKPLWVVWRAVALQMQSESGDMCGGFGSLAVQGFLAPFPAREPHGGREENGVNLGKGRRRRTFSTR